MIFIIFESFFSNKSSAQKITSLKRDFMGLFNLVLLVILVVLRPLPLEESLGGQENSLKPHLRIFSILIENYFFLGFFIQLNESFHLFVLKYD